MNDLLRRLLFLPEQASTFSLRVDHLHYFVIITTMIASTIVGVVAIVFLIRYRRRPGHQLTAHVDTPSWFEVVAIGIPLSFFLTWFAIGFGDFVWVNTPPKDAMDVYVMAKQWMWKFAYPEGPNAINVLRVPVHKPVRLLLTSRDVIHSFFVPAFRLKKDVLPGRYTETWFEATKPGTFEVLCAEYCGTSHSMMRAQVIAMPEEQYQAWLDEERRTLPLQTDGGSIQTPSTMARQGELAANKYGCLRCHTTDGTPHIGPTWKGLYGRKVTLETGETLLADPAYLTESMMDPMAKIVAGYPAVMPSFQGRLPAPEAAAIVEYIKSLSPPETEGQPEQGPENEPTRR